MAEIDTTNKFVVSATMDDRIAILVPPRGAMSNDDALLLAAYLVALAAVPRDRFLEVLDAVEGS